MANRVARREKAEKEAAQKDEEMKYLRQSKWAVKRTHRVPPITDLYDHNLQRLARYVIRGSGTWKCNIKSKKVEKRKISLIRHLFKKYPVPRFLEDVWTWNNNRTHVEETRHGIDWHDWCVAAYQGRSLYKETDACLYMTKKEVHLFLTLAPENNHPYENIWWAKAYAHTKDTAFANIITSSKLNHKPVEDDFWLSVMHFFSKNRTDARDIGNYVDFLQEQKRMNENFTMKGRTLQNLSLLRDEWHIDLARSRDCKMEWEGLPIANKAYIDKKDGKNLKFMFNQILNSKDLASEGRNMRHCVYSYLDSCANGTCSIWSLSVDDGINSRSRLLTIEVRNYAVWQVSGKVNRYPSNYEKIVVRRWANDNGLKMGRYAL